MYNHTSDYLEHLIDQVDVDVQGMILDIYLQNKFLGRLTIIQYFTLVFEA
jgi:hypothetical protein